MHGPVGGDRRRLEFDRWKEGLRTEFDEALRRAPRAGGEPGEGSIRGAGAERRVEEWDLGDDESLRGWRFLLPLTPMFAPELHGCKTFSPLSWWYLSSIGPR
jgi:hypothetical protein